MDLVLQVSNAVHNCSDIDLYISSKIDTPTKLEGKFRILYKTNNDYVTDYEKVLNGRVKVKLLDTNGRIFWVNLLDLEDLLLKDKKSLKQNFRYVVGQFDTIESIARKLKIPEENVLESNNWSKDIRATQILYIPIYGS